MWIFTTVITFYFTVKNSYKSLFTFHSPAAGFVLLNRLRSWRQWLCLSGWIQTQYCTRQRAVLVYVRTRTHIHTHTQNHWVTSEEPPESLEQMPKLLSVSLQSTRMLFFFFLMPPVQRDPLTLCSCLLFTEKGSANSGKKKNTKNKLLRSQVGYDQLLHFIPDLSGDLKLLRFVVLIEWPGKRMHIVNKLLLIIKLSLSHLTGA